MPEWNAQVIWLQLAVIMILALQSLEAKDNGKKTSPCKTCTLNHDNMVTLNISVSLKS